MRGKPKREVEERTVTWSSTSIAVGRYNFAQELLIRATSLAHVPLCMLFIPSLCENPLVLIRGRVYGNFLEDHPDALLPLLKEVWKRKGTLIAKLKRPLPYVTLFSIPGQKSTLGVLMLRTKRPIGREHRSYLAIVLSVEGKMLEQYLSAEEEHVHSHREKVLTRAQELHRGIAQEIAGISLFTAALRQHLASHIPEDTESLEFLDIIDAGLKQSALHIHAMLQELHEDALQCSSFRENLQELLERQGPITLRVATQDFAFPLRARRLFLEIAGEVEEAVFRWSRKKRAKAKAGTYRGEVYLLFRGDGEKAQDFPFGIWHIQDLQGKISRVGGRLRVYRGRKGGITVVVMMPAYVW